MIRSMLMAAGLLAAFSAYAGEVNTVSEPGSLELLALGGVMALVLALRGRGKR